MNAGCGRPPEAVPPEAAPPGGQNLTHYRLRLFVAGSSARSLRTVQELRQSLAAALGAAMDLEVVDIYQQPELAERDGVVVAPTLVRLSPAPVRRVIGDLSDEARVLRALMPRDDGDDE